MKWFMVVIAFIAFGMAAVRINDESWADVVLALTVSVLCTANVVASYRRGAWAGFAVLPAREVLLVWYALSVLLCFVYAWGEGLAGRKPEVQPTLAVAARTAACGLAIQIALRVGLAASALVRTDIGRRRGPPETATAESS